MRSYAIVRLRIAGWQSLQQAVALVYQAHQLCMSAQAVRESQGGGVMPECVFRMNACSLMRIVSGYVAEQEVARHQQESLKML